MGSFPETYNDTNKRLHSRFGKCMYLVTYLACVAGVNRGRGNLGSRERVVSRAQIPPSPFNAGHAGYDLVGGPDGKTFGSRSVHPDREPNMFQFGPT